MAMYKGFDINTAGTLKPWGPREEQAWRDIIDTVSADTINSLSGKQITGHKHYSLYDGYGTKVVECDNNNNILMGGVAGRRTVVSVPNNDGVFQVKTIDGYSAIRVDTYPGESKKVVLGSLGHDYTHEINFGYNRTNAFTVRGVYGYEAIKLDALNGYTAFKAIKGTDSGVELRLHNNGELANAGEEWVDYATGHPERFHGWVSTLGFVLNYKIIGKIMHVRMYLRADSNSTDCWIDLPYHINARTYTDASLFIAPVGTMDLGHNWFGVGCIRYDGEHYHLDRMAMKGGGQWSTSNIKYVEGSFTVPIS